MKKKIALRVVLPAAIAGAVLSPAAAGEEAEGDTHKIVYGRSVGESDVPEMAEIFVVDDDGANAVRLTDNSKEDAFPVLSPDGSRIAFARNTGGQYDLFVMNADGSAVRRLTHTRNGDEVLPAWSPDGKKLAITVTTATNDGWQSDIYRLKIASGRTFRLTHTATAKEFAPDWSPDGNEIAFTKQNQRRENYGIAAVGRDATGLRWLVVNPLSKNGYTDVNPSWSPDSQWIAFSRDHGDDPYVDIYKVSRDGSQVLPVTQLSQLAENPVWGDDGRILFMHDEGIAVVGENGGDVTHITPTRTGLPYWWPDW